MDRRATYLSRISCPYDGTTWYSIPDLHDYNGWQYESLFIPTSLATNATIELKLRTLGATVNSERVFLDDVLVVGGIATQSSTDARITMLAEEFQDLFDRPLDQASFMHWVYSSGSSVPESNIRQELIDSATGADHQTLFDKGIVTSPPRIITYVHADHLGSVVAETDQAGKVQKRFHYKPFGATFEQQQDDMAYAGHKFDADIGLSYMQARYYDPVLGRFYGNDPVGYTAKNPVMSFNRYMYVNNNPYKYTDPDGEFLLTVLGGAAVGGLISGGLEAYKQVKSGGDLNWGKIGTEAGKGAVIGAAAGTGAGLMGAMHKGLEISKTAAVVAQSTGAATGVTIAEGTKIIAKGAMDENYGSSGEMAKDMGDMSANIVGAATGPLAQGATSVVTKSPVIQNAVRETVTTYTTETMKDELND